MFPEQPAVSSGSMDAGLSHGLSRHGMTFQGSSRSSPGVLLGVHLAWQMMVSPLSVMGLWDCLLLPAPALKPIWPAEVAEVKIPAMDDDGR